MRVLVVARATEVLDSTKLAETGLRVSFNQTPDAEGILAIVDLLHEAQVPDRWPNLIYIVGDTVSKFKARARMVLPEDRATQMLLDALKYENVAEDGENDGSDTNV